ncbi:MAG TPA: MTH1187 family thiamine-binding protein [Acidimicrobiales bacterium]|nr:MTH1187 family thiamine-binding protein [Acidimicrobiales bacterium]
MLAAFSISPLGGTSDSVGDVVADCVGIVRQSGLPNETNAMFTNVEGEWDEVMAVLKACADRVLQEASRVSMVIKLDIRPGHQGMLTQKVQRVEKALG